MFTQEFGKPVPPLMFLIGLRGATEKASLGARIISPDNTILVDLDSARGIAIPPLEGSARALAGIGFEGLVFKQGGTHTVEFVVNNTKILRTSFTVEHRIIKQVTL
jgi:hypothetical protein